MNARILTRYSPRPGETKATEQQLEIIYDWCRQEGHKVIAEPYSDEAKSGKAPEFASLSDLSKHRPALLALLADLQPGEIAVAYHLNRWARDPFLGMTIAREVRRKGAFFATVKNGIFDLEDDGQELLALIEWWNSRRERKQIAERCRIKSRLKQANGYLVGGTVPFGYREIEPERLVIDGKEVLRRRKSKDPAEQAVIARIRELDAQGYSATAIAATLQDERVRGRSGPISRQLVGKILARGGSPARSPG